MKIRNIEIVNPFFKFADFAILIINISIHKGINGNFWKKVYNLLKNITKKLNVR